LPIFDDYGGTDPSVRSIVVSYSTNILVCVLTVLVCFRLLGLLGFSVNQRIAGALALLFGTTFLHYTQNMMENNLILLLTLTGLTFQYEWLRTGSRRALLAGSAALGANLITRLTTGMDLLAVGLFLLLASWFTNVRERALGARFLAYAKIAVPVYAVFGAIDRAYQYYRFGSVFGTYLQAFAREQKLLNPDLPAAYPFETPFHSGFFGALFAPEKSIFLFDPLLILTVLLGVLAWRHFGAAIRAYLISFWLLLFAYINFYARYTDWSGDTAWGDRYVSTAAQIVAFVSVPLLLRYRAQVGRAAWGMGVALVAASIVVQASSVVFWCPLERYQMETRGHPTFVVGLRLENIVAFASGKMEKWGLTNAAMREDAWDYTHITTVNFLPFVLKRVGVAPGWAVNAVTGVWFAALAGLAGVLAFLRSRALRNEFGASDCS
jgi:hypothetical protein